MVFMADLYFCIFYSILTKFWHFKTFFDCKQFQMKNLMMMELNLKVLSNPLITLSLCNWYQSFLNFESSYGRILQFDSQIPRYQAFLCLRNQSYLDFIPEFNHYYLFKLYFQANYYLYLYVKFFFNYLQVFVVYYFRWNSRQLAWRAFWHIASINIARIKIQLVWRINCVVFMKFFKQKC